VNHSETNNLHARSTFVKNHLGENSTEELHEEARYILYCGRYGSRAFQRGFRPSWR
jgi:hypothetical protein